MEHQYNTRLHKSRDEHSDEEKPTEARKITEFLRPLEIEFNKEFGNKKAKKEDGSDKPLVDEDMELTNELLTGCDTEFSCTDSQDKTPTREEKKLACYPLCQGFHWKELTWLMDIDTKQPKVKEGKYMSIKDIIRLGLYFFPGLKEIKMKEGTGYALFEASGYKRLRKPSRYPSPI